MRTGETGERLLISPLAYLHILTAFSRTNTKHSIHTLNNKPETEVNVLVPLGNLGLFAGVAHLRNQEVKLSNIDRGEGVKLEVETNKGIFSH